MADQVREARAKFEAWWITAFPVWAPSSRIAAERAWEAATASHAADVEALRSALKDLLDAWDCVSDLRGWDKDHLTAITTARAALKGDKP